MYKESDFEQADLTREAPCEEPARQYYFIARVRAYIKAREAELLAVKAFENKEGLPERPDLLQALNRLSSFLYLIMLELKE